MWNIMMIIVEFSVKYDVHPQTVDMKAQLIHNELFQPTAISSSKYDSLPVSVGETVQTEPIIHC